MKLPIYAYTISEKVENKKIDISNYHPIFQELICIQTGKSKRKRYHLMFLSLTINNILGYERIGFFSHDSFKIQKGSICDGAGENQTHIKILHDIFGTIEVDRAYVRPPIPSKLEWKINEICEYKSSKDNQWYLARIKQFIKKLYGEKNCHEIIFNNKEISWKHIKGVYNHTSKHATAKATKFTKRHIYLISWSKICVDLAEDTLSKEVEDALAFTEELKKISEGTREFIKYSRKYQQIMHGKINFQSLEDPQSREWISSQCQFGLIISINGFLEILEFILKKYSNSIIQPRRISQDMLEGLSSKSNNYGKADNNGTGIVVLKRRDYRKDVQSSITDKNKLSKKIPY
ncbi:hypothetical protein Glove_122g116 [Diversispora epigaea]|uniref:Transposable element P transposase-like GTP-binding insertion domain-containing protein n=1 Tax=Diversispora epigaea TaxID=1348612 RepID=A0A397J5H5_9GLOM|nr:hypothetical protein Glove_122g116 [Diversispora epigaea]